MGFFNGKGNIVGQLATMAKANRAQSVATSAQQQPLNSGYSWGMGGAGTTPQTAQGTSSLIGKALGGQTKMAPSISPRQAYAQILNPNQIQPNTGSIARNMAIPFSSTNPNIGRPGAGNFTNDLSRSITSITNMNTRPQTPINPKALGNNTQTIANMYGRIMPGSFDRNMGPLTQMADPLTGQVIDPTMDQSTAGMNPVIQGDTAIPPPEGVELPITPIYDINQ